MIVSLASEMHLAMLLESVPRNFWREWDWPIVPAVLTAGTALLYLRGWVKARQLRPAKLPAWRAGCFAGGLLALWLAIGSPLDAFDDYLLAAHMIQHFVLMSVAPPLLLLGSPTVPMLRGLPRGFIRKVLRPVLRWGWTHTTLRVILHPATLWLVMNATYLGWHVPAAFELTLHSEPIHNVEHLCFLVTSLGFWWYVIQPWPSEPRFPRWTVIPYLLTSDIVNTILSAILTFSGRVLYPSYAAAPRVTSLSPLQDQVAAGAEMWVLNSIVFLIPAVAIVIRLLSPARLRKVEEGFTRT